ncbi:MAG TPA: terminase small subunit [Deltaproteobacteria bacterium]|nr:terminase small subunit [Deltaproteobacteria bacterium]
MGQRTKVGQLNTGQERFVKLVKREPDPAKRMEHEWLVECAVAAGYKGKTKQFCKPGENPIDVTVRQLMSNPKVLAALQGVKIEEQLKNLYGPDNIKRRLGSMMNANIDDYITWSVEGVRVKPSDKLTRELKSRILRITERRDKSGNVMIDVEMANPIDAADKLARIYAMYKDKLGIEKDPIDEDLEKMSTGDLYELAKSIITKQPDLADVFARVLTDTFGPSGGGKA